MSNSEALVFDAIRTPRGRGKVNGSLHTAKPVDLVVGLMHETLVRNEHLDPKRVDDVVLGCVSPVGDQGADIAKTAAIKAGLPRHGRRRSAQPLLRLGPGGGQHRRAEGRLRLGGPRLRRRRRVDVARADGLRRRRLGDGPRDQLRHVLHPAGHQRRPDRDASRSSAARTSTPTPPARRSARPRRRPRATSPTRWSRSRTSTSTSCSTTTSSSAPGTTVETLGRPQAVVRRRSARWAASTRSRCRSTTGSRRSTTSTRPATRSGHRRRRLAGGDRQRADRPRAGPDAAGADPGHRGLRRRPDDHADRPGARPAARRWPRPA